MYVRREAVLVGRTSLASGNAAASLKTTAVHWVWQKEQEGLCPAGKNK